MNGAFGSRIHYGRRSVAISNRAYDGDGGNGGGGGDACVFRTEDNESDPAERNVNGAVEGSELEKSCAAKCSARARGWLRMRGALKSELAGNWKHIAPMCDLSIRTR